MKPNAWEPFGIPDNQYDPSPENSGVRWFNLSLRRPRSQADRSATWLRCAMLALGLLAAAAAAVSFAAQYQMIFAAKGLRWAAALEAAIPDAAALVFASLGIALALHGRRAIRARVLNVASVATSVCMNLLAATPGWRNLAIWVMPPIAYALASDTAIGVIRAWAMARQRELGEALADDDATPLAVTTGLALWMLRLVLAPPSTLRGFRAWVVEECPVAPGRREITALPDVERCPDCLSVLSLDDGSCAGCGLPGGPEPEGSELCQPDPYGPEWPERTRQHRSESKTSRFLQLVEDRHGPLAAIDPSRVSQIATDLAPEVDLNPGSARSALRPLVLAAQNGHAS